MSTKIEPNGAKYRVADVMRRFGITRNTVANWEKAGVLPPAAYPLTPDGKRYGRSKWWAREDIEAREKVFEEKARGQGANR